MIDYFQSIKNNQSYFKRLFFDFFFGFNEQKNFVRNVPKKCRLALSSILRSFSLIHTFLSYKLCCFIYFILSFIEYVEKNGWLKTFQIGILLGQK